jgi:hypothetical protein
MSTPSSMNTLSNAKAPPIVTWLALGVLLVSPGAISATSDSVRPIGRVSTAACGRLIPAVGFKSIDGVEAITTTDSVATTSRSVASSVVVPPSDTKAFSVIGARLGNSKVTA